MQKKEEIQTLQGIKVVVMAGLFLSIAVFWQSLRFFVPWLIGPWNVFFIGSLVKATLVLAVLLTGQYRVAGIAFLLPVIAFLQGQLPLLPLVPVVGVGGALYALLVWRWWGQKCVWLAPLISAAVLFGGTQLVLACVSLPPPLAAALTMMLSWPQVITGSVGIFLAGRIYKRLSTFSLK